MGGSSADPASAAGAVALVGFMASGKSAVGRLAAAVLGVPFVDTDALIAQRAGSIAAIFDALGEAGFRRIERAVVLEVLDQALRNACIVALGGGAVLSGEVREALRRLPCVAWLNAPPGVLWDRAAEKGAVERPLARDEEAFARLLAGRSALYAEVASVEIVNDGSRPLDAVVEAVVSLARGQAPRCGVRSNGGGGPA
jgi:shikimate kinase